tara:strand:+ start:1633 stop:2097 length:465 start_codon:yes stop_codon:yes gene_type:complete
MKFDSFTELILYKKIRVILLFILLINCSKDEVKRNPYLNEISFRHLINLNLPEYNNLNYAGGSQLISYKGINGILVLNLNGNDFFAWEATCSNHEVEQCSSLKLNGLLALCSCDDYKYSLATGQLIEGPKNSDSQYPLLNYRVEKENNIIIISN